MSAPFTEVWPRSELRDRIICDLAAHTIPWQILAASLYLSTGRYVPEEVKRDGLAFGFCDSGGNRVHTLEAATHIGWTPGKAG